jgi:hypothetical protein
VARPRSVSASAAEGAPISCCKKDATVTAELKPAIRTGFRAIDWLAIRSAESERRDEHALLLSPWPERLFAVAPTWARLAGHAHLVTVDRPGFGHSERRDDLLLPGAMGELVVRLEDAIGPGVDGAPGRGPPPGQRGGSGAGARWATDGARRTGAGGGEGGEKPWL